MHRVRLHGAKAVSMVPRAMSVSAIRLPDWGKASPRGVCRFMGGAGASTLCQHQGGLGVRHYVLRQAQMKAVSDTGC